MLKMKLRKCLFPGRQFRRVSLFAVALGSISVLLLFIDFLNVLAITQFNSLRKIISFPQIFVQKQLTSIEVSDTSQEALASVYRYLNFTEDIESYTFPYHQIGDYVFLNKDICANAPIIDIVIIVHTSPINFIRRQRIRETFANSTLFLPSQIRVAFLLGRSNHSGVYYDKLVAEFSQHGDTVMAEFVDSYHNLTLKGLMGLRWAIEYCSNARFVLKSDDDVIVDMYRLLSYMKDKKFNDESSLYCNLWPPDKVPVQRTGKWKIPSNMFYGLQTFPLSYCSGFFVLITLDLVKPLLEAAKRAPFFWVDDIYLFGILPFVAKANLHSLEYRVNTFMSSWHAHTCLSRNETCQLLVTLVHNNMYQKLWSLIRRQHLSHTSIN